MLCETARLLTWVSLKCRKCDWKEMQKKTEGSAELTSKSTNLCGDEISETGCRTSLGWKWTVRIFFLNTEISMDAFCTSGICPEPPLLGTGSASEGRRMEITAKYKTCLGSLVDPWCAPRSCCRLACSRELELVGCMLQRAVRPLTATQTSPKSSITLDFSLVAA